MPPEDDGAPVTPAPEGEPDDTLYMRGMRDERFRRAQNTALGGYGELHFNLDWPEPGGPSSTQLDLHRLVLFVAHNFDSQFRFYTELEVEHAIVFGGQRSGELGIEQAYVDWRVPGDALGVRAGVLVVPMGILNQWHEPPIFHGVERPLVDRLIVPTTWREGGVGIFGQPLPGLRYELYAVGGLDPRGFSAAGGIGGGRQRVMEALAGFPAFTGRLEVEPTLGFIAGVSGYFNLAGQSAHLGIDLPVIGVSADARTRWKGLEARAMVACFFIEGVSELRALTSADGTPLGVDVGSRVFGAYGEVGYDVLHPTGLGHSLVPFVRVEWLDTTLGEENQSFDQPWIAAVVAGLTYRPMPQIAVKVDVTLRRPEIGAGENAFNAGIGWMF